MTNESKVAVFQACELLPTENVVTHADYKSLEDECERLRARVGELEASCDELAVHVADLRESLSVEIGRDISLVSAER